MKGKGLFRVLFVALVATAFFLLHPKKSPDLVSDSPTAVKSTGRTTGKSGLSVKKAQKVLKNAGKAGPTNGMGKANSRDRTTGVSKVEDPQSDEEPAVDAALGTGAEESRTLPGTDAQKIAALEALAQFRSSQAEAGTAKPLPAALEGYWGGNDEEDAADDDSPEEDQEDGVDPEGDDFRNTVNMMTLALEDTSPNVRDAAFETMFQLPEAERSVLSLQVLGGDDVVLKDQLLETAGHATDEFSVTLLMQALDDEDAEIREKASSRLSALFSETFASADEALSWWEENHETFIFSKNGVIPAPAQTVAPVKDDASATTISQ